MAVVAGHECNTVYSKLEPTMNAKTRNTPREEGPEIGQILTAAECRNAKSDPRLVQAAEETGATLLSYDMPSRDDHWSASASSYEGDSTVELLRDPDGVVVTQSYGSIPTALSWYIPNQELQRRFGTRSPNASDLAEDDILKPQGAMVKWHDVVTSNENFGLLPAGELGLEESESFQTMERLDNSIVSWVDRIREYTVAEWDRWRAIPRRLHILMSDGSSWLLPGIGHYAANDDLYARRRAAFRVWQRQRREEAVAVAVLLVEPESFLLYAPVVDLVLQTNHVRVRLGCPPNPEFMWWLSSPPYRECDGFVTASV